MLHIGHQRARRKELPMAETIYHQLAEHLTKLGMGYPPGEELEEILRENFTPEEASVALAIPTKVPPLHLASLDEIAQRTDHPSSDLAEVLECLASRGLVFSQRVLLALTKKKLSREKAFELVQINSLKAWNENLDFRELIHADREITEVLSPDEIDECFSLEPYLDKIDYIYERVFSDES